MERDSAAALEAASDEALAARCRDGIDAAERELLRRYMQAMYWLPQRAFGAPEEVLADFLVYAVETIRARNTLTRYDPERGAKFSTWFAVVLRRLYLDWLRSLPDAVTELELQEDAAPAGDLPDEGVLDALLDHLQPRCRTLFKLLLCHAMTLDADDLAWMAETASISRLDLLREIAGLEESLRETDVRLADRHDRLAKALWWQRVYEKKLITLERELEHPWTEQHEELDATYRKLQRRRQQVRRQLAELGDARRVATAPYKELARLLRVNENTLASWISRCRSAAAREYRRLVDDTEGSSHAG